MTYYTKNEFNNFLKNEVVKMQKIKKQALKLLIDANNYYWIHQTKWMDEPCLQLPQDMLAIQEIFYKTQPKYIIETGTGWGGLTLFCSTLTDMWGGHVISIDINMPNDLVKRLYNKSQKITLINGSSIDKETIRMIGNIIENQSNMIILDSNHTEDHVLQELELYSQFVNKGMYIVICDTIIQNIPNNMVERKRDWCVGNNPWTALQKFLKQHPNEYKIDYELQNKLLLSCNTYLEKL